MIRWILPCLCVVVCWTCAPTHAEPPQLPKLQVWDTHIAIHCSLNLLQVWRDGVLIREFVVDTGKGGLGKKTEGDHKTPLGMYEISWMASRTSPHGLRIRERTSWCKENQFVYARSGPSMEKLWSDAYGGNQASVLSINYPNAKDMEMGRTGDCIHIHADKFHNGGVLRKSYGCIHMYPQDASELYSMVTIGVPVRIFP